MNPSGIYIWKYKGQPIYVGQSKHIFNRVKDEYCNGSINEKMFNILQKLPEFEIEFHTYPEKDLDKWESYWINRYHTLTEGFNIQPNNYDFTKNREVEDKIRYGNLATRVICLDDGKIYSNYSDAAAHYNVFATNVARVCKGYRDYAGGKKFCLLSDIKTIKFLPRQLLKKIFSGMQEDEWDYIDNNTNFFDTIQYLEDRPDWEDRWVACRKKVRKQNADNRVNGGNFSCKLFVCYE